MPPSGRVQRVPGGRYSRQAVERRRQPLGAGLQHARAMRLQPSRFGELQQHRLRKLVGMQIGGFLGLAQPVDQRLRVPAPNPRAGRES